MRITLFIVFIAVSLSACQKDALLLPQTGDPVRLDTVVAYMSKSFGYPLIASVTCGQTLVLDAAVKNARYRWIPDNDTTQTITVSNIPDKVALYYSVEIIKPDTVYMLTAQVNGNHRPRFFIPNVFTPNGDGINDVLYVSAICYTDLHLQIFDTFSNSLIYESTDPNLGWDGSYKGKIVPAGKYRYQIEITTLDNEVTKSSGYFQLIR